MRITAVTSPVKVSYKAAGRTYNATGSEGDASDSNNRTSSPFDEITLAVGESFDVPAGAEVVSSVQMGPDAGSASVDSAAPASDNSVL